MKPFNVHCHHIILPNITDFLKLVLKLISHENLVVSCQQLKTHVQHSCLLYKE